MTREDLDKEQVEDILSNYELDKEQLILFLGDLGEFKDWEDLVLLAGVLDEK